MLSETIQKIKAAIKRRESEIMTVTVVTMVGFISFGLGRFSSLYPEQLPLRLQQGVVGPSGASKRAAALESQLPGESVYIASRNGSRYHLPTCPGAKQIKEENKIWFQTRKEAEEAGYQPAANCQFPPE